MHVKIDNYADIKRIASFMSQRGKFKTLYLEAKGDGILLIVWGSRQLEIRVAVRTPGAVELNREALADLFQVFTSKDPVEIWTEGVQVKFKQRNFIAAKNVLTDEDGDILTTSPEAMRRRLLKEERKSLLARLRAVEKELAA